MAISPFVQWEVRTTGNDLNGGGFKDGASGTDFSQQDSPQLSNTDLAIDATFNTKVSSAGSPFTSTSVGNIIQVSAGTGFTTGFYEVTAVVAGLATVDRAIGTTSSTGGTFRLGGGLLTVATGFTVAGFTSNNIVWLKSGTYTLTTTLTQPNIEAFTLHGYQTTHGDDTGTRPLITSATNSVNLISCANSSIRTEMVVNNVSFSHTAGTRGNGFYSPTNGPARPLIVVNCVVDGCLNGFLGDFGTVYYFHYLSIFKTEIKNCINAGVHNNGNTWLVGCYIHNNGTSGFTNGGGSGTSTLISAFGCIFANNTTNGMLITSGATAGLSAQNCVFYVNAEGISTTPAAQGYGSTIINCIFEGNTSHALKGDASGVSFRFANAFYNNAANLFTTGGGFPYLTDSSDIALSGSPFTNAGSGDFSLNNTAGAGAACKAVGFPGTIPNAGTSTSLDIGALQSTGGGGGGGGVRVVAGMLGGMRG